MTCYQETRDPQLACIFLLSHCLGSTLHETRLVNSIYCMNSRICCEKVIEPFSVWYNRPPPSGVQLGLIEAKTATDTPFTFVRPINGLRCSTKISSNNAISLRFGPICRVAILGVDHRSATKLPKCILVNNNPDRRYLSGKLSARGA
jgi:hypothetical protein